MGTVCGAYFDFETEIDDPHGNAHGFAEKGQSREDAMRGVDDAINRRLAKGGMMNLGRALHTGQDIFAPGHDYQEYSNPALHLAAELGASALWTMSNGLLSVGHDDAINKSLELIREYRQIHPRGN